MKKKQAQKKTRIPEALGNRICGVRLYVFILVFNAGTHITLFLIHEQSVQNFFRLLLSFIFFIYPLYYVADTLWSLQPAVRGILSGKILINRKYYMNTVRKEVLRDALLPVTVSVPIYTESNEIIFKTLSESLAAVGRYREFSGKKANLVVSDDGLAPLLGGRCTKEKAEALVKAILSDAYALTANEKKAAERIVFYRKHNITFIARPAAGRAGLFKKASNLNFTLKLCKAVSETGSAESLFCEGGAFNGGYAEGDIVTHEVILLLDKDSGLKERIIEAILPEFAADEKLAYVQCASEADDLNENYYAYATGHQVNNLFHNIWPCKALQGFFVPLVGHNVFIRKSALEKSGLWAENKVSEDYDKAICFYGMGYHGKYAQLRGLEFTECASRTFTEETGKQRRYAYGLFEMIFDGTIAPGKARACDAFYMLLYFCSDINQVLLLPTVLFESYFGNTHLLWVGFLFCMLCFIFLPIIRGVLMRRMLPGEHSEKIICNLIIAVSFVGHSFSFLAGACRYLGNKIKENGSPFPSTNVDQLRYRFSDGVKLLFDYLRKNPVFPVIIFLCIDRGIFLLTIKGLEPVTAFTYGYILFCAVFVPVLLTPQLFAGLGAGTLMMKAAERGNLKMKNGKSNKIRNENYQNTADIPLSPLIVEKTEDPLINGRDVELFLADYNGALQTSLNGEDFPKELLSEYIFESCIRKDPESRKELYLLRAKKDGARALLRVTNDYPEEDALYEAELLSRLSHPGIPKAYFSCERNGKKYLVREFIEGRTLYDIVSSGGSLSSKDIFGIAVKLAGILSYLHTQKPPVIHRDIKPQNIIVGTDGSIHLIDFGIARVHKRERSQDTSVVLTLDYASPEQYGFEQTTPLSDIYSLGVVLLFLATGHTIRSGLEAQIVNNKLRTLIDQCIAFNPKARIQSSEAIRAYILQNGSMRTQRQRKQLATAAGLLAASIFLSVLFCGLGFAFERRNARKRSFELGYAYGYTDGYNASPVLRRSEIPVKTEGYTSAGNMALRSGSFAAQGEGHIYYIADDGIMRMSANGTEPELFLKDKRAEGLSYNNGWLYYSSDGLIMQTNIYTNKTDVLCEKTPGKLYLAGTRFFILASNGLYRLDPMTGEAVLLNKTGGCEYLNADDENMYFIGSDDHSLYSCDLSGNNIKKLKGGGCSCACLLGQNLFCTVYENDRESLIKINLLSGEESRLLEAQIALLNITEDGIFFLDKSEGTINRCSFDGRIRERVSGNHATDFNIVGGWIFYHNKEDGNRLWCARLDGSNDHPAPNGR